MERKTALNWFSSKVCLFISAVSLKYHQMAVFIFDNNITKYQIVCEQRLKKKTSV